MSMLDDPWRMAIPNPDEVLNGAFAIDGSLSVRGIYADEIRLRKGATYSDFLTSVGTLDDYGDLTAIIKGLWGVTTETGVDWNIIKRAADVKIANSVTAKDATLNLVKLTLKGAEGDALPSMEPEQYRRDREEFFAWFDHFKNWALKDHFHDERYALVKHPHVKADITDWAHRHLYDDIIGGPKVPGGEGMDKVAGLATSTAIFGGALIVGGIKYYKDRKGFREYYKLENEKKQWSELKDKEMTEVAEKKAEANKLMTDAQRQEESALTALRSAERQVAEERTKMILDAEEELKRINEQREAAKAKKLQEIEALTAGTELLEAQRKEIEDRKKKLEKEAETRRQLLEEEEETRRKAGELQTGRGSLAHGTAETQTTPRPDPRPAAERLPSRGWIEERYRKAQADKEYANRVIEERKQQAKENAARRNAEIEEQRRKIAERKAAEEEARKTKVETDPDDITLAERDDVSVEEMRPGTARLPSEGVFQTLDRRVMGDSDVILRNALMPYGDWNRATADALADFDLERFTTKEQRDAAETLFSAAGTANNDGMSFGAADLFQGAGIDLVGAGLGGQDREAEFFDTFRDQMIMTVGSFGLQTGMSSALSALTKMRIGTVGGLGLSILAGAIAQVIVDIINGRSAEEIVKNFFKYPVDWATDTIQFIAELSQQIYDWGVETWGDEASQLRNRINRLEASWAPDFWELRLNEIKEPKELQAFIRALDNSINDYRTPKDQKTLLEIDRATVLFLSQLTVKMQEGFGRLRSP
eukprot:tig00021441_g21562.t1